MESRIKDALQYLEEFPAAKIATVAREFGIPRSTLRNRLQGRQPRAGLPAANTKLTRPEEAALCRYIDRLDRINLAVRAEYVTDAANTILRARTKAPNSAAIPSVGQKWTTRFLKRHGYSKRLQKRLEANRTASEDLERVLSYFNELRKQLERVQPEDIWNMDETGFRIGVGKDQLVITRRTRAQYLGTPENRESATAIEAISAGGSYIPAFLILSGQRHMGNWYRTPELEEDTKIILSDSGYSNDEISFQWLQHFEEWTKIRKRGGRTESPIRLLILDGHGSHHTLEFLEYCDTHNIIPFGLPPHLTHLLQPLDMAVFQPLKHYQAKALDTLIRDGIGEITKLEFLSYIQQIRKQAFKKDTILSAFQKTGIQPFNPQPVLQQLAERQPEKTPSPPLQSSSPPNSTPSTLRQMNRLSQRIEKAVQEDQSLEPALRQNISRFLKGSLINATELLQTKRDLGRTKHAETVRNQRRALKNHTLQHGGVLTVAEGRAMVKKRDEDGVAKARRVVEAAELKA